MESLRRLWRRRVPQVLGVYLATGWAVVEVTAFLVGRYRLTDNLVDIVLLGLILLVPAVLVLAWNRFGRHEGDRLTRAEGWACVLNVAVAGIVLWVVFGGATVGRATTTVEVEDAAGARVVREVPRQELLVKLVVFNPAASTEAAPADWEPSALAVALQVDLMQDPFVTALRPILPGQIERLRGAGQDIGRAPRREMVAIARDFEAQRFIAGELMRRGETLAATLEVYGVEPTRLIASVRAEARDVFGLTDALTPQLRAHLGLAAERAAAADDLPVSELLTPSLEAMAEFGLSDLAVLARSDLNASIAHLERALAHDPKFALAGLALGLGSYLMGRGEQARAGIDAALAGVDRLLEPTQFQVRAIDAELRGDLESSERLRRLWVELYPSDPQARQTLALHYVTRGNRLAEALVQLEALRALGPGYDATLLQIGQIRTTLGDLERAAEAYDEYRRLHPGQPVALLALASLKLRLGEVAAAETLYRDAAALPGGGADARAALIKFLVGQGRDAEAEAALATAEAAAGTSIERIGLLGLRITLRLRQGRVAEARAAIESLVAQAPEALRPMYAISQQAAIAGLLAPAEVDALLAAIDAAFPGASDAAQSMRTQSRWQVLFDRDDAERLGAVARDLAAQIERNGRDDFRFLVPMSEARLAELAGQAARAASLYRDALAGQRASTNAEALVTESQLLRLLLRAERRAGELESAAATAAALARLDPATPESLIERAELARAVGDRAGARELAERALSRLANADPGHPHKAAAEAVLAALPPARP